MTDPATTIREALGLRYELEADADVLAALTELEQQLAEARRAYDANVEDWHQADDRAIAAERERDQLAEAKDNWHRSYVLCRQERDQLADKLDTSRAYLKATQNEADQLADTLRAAVRTIDRWDATIGQPPDPPTAEEVLFGVRDLARAALDRNTQP